MEAGGGPGQDDLTHFRQLVEHPARYHLFHALRIIEARYADAPRLGESRRSRQDRVRLTQVPELAFPPSTISSFRPGTEGKPARLANFFFGLFGPHGPLPLHLTEYARDRLRNHRDPTFVAFADMLTHRLMGLFYRAWAAGQPAPSFDRAWVPYDANDPALLPRGGAGASDGGSMGYGAEDTGAAGFGNGNGNAAGGAGGAGAASGAGAWTGNGAGAAGGAGNGAGAGAGAGYGAGTGTGAGAAARSPGGAGAGSGSQAGGGYSPGSPGNPFGTASGAGAGHGASGGASGGTGGGAGATAGSAGAGLAQSGALGQARSGAAGHARSGAGGPARPGVTGAGAGRPGGAGGAGSVGGAGAAAAGPAGALNRAGLWDVTRRANNAPGEDAAAPGYFEDPDFTGRKRPARPGRLNFASDGVQRKIAALAGYGTGAMNEADAMPDLSKRHFAGHLANGPKHAEGLRSILSAFFEAPVEIQQFVGHWLQLEPDDTWTLGQSGLGRGTSIGSQVWSRDSKFRIKVGPVDLKTYLRLMPGRGAIERMEAIVRNYVGDRLAWDVNLVLKAEEVPRSALGARAGLGYNTWAGRRRDIARDADDLILTPPSQTRAARALAGH